MRWHPVESAPFAVEVKRIQSVVVVSERDLVGILGWCGPELVGQVEKGEESSFTPRCILP